MTEAEHNRLLLDALRRRNKLRVNLAVRKEKLKALAGELRELGELVYGVEPGELEITYRGGEGLRVQGHVCRWPSMEVVEAGVRAVSDVERALGEAERHLRELDPGLV